MKSITIIVSLLLCMFAVSAQSKQTIYSGTLKGYGGHLSFKTGQLIVYNVVTGLPQHHIIEVNPDGQFTVTFPLAHKQECWVTFPFFSGSVYFEPGKTITHNFDLTQAKGIPSIFTGDCARINNDLNRLRPVLMDANWNTIDDAIYQSSPAQYKDYYIKDMARRKTIIDSIARASGINRTSHEIALRGIEYSTAFSLIHYEDEVSDVYRRKNNIPFDRSIKVSAPAKPDTAYYSFLRDLKYNDVSAMKSFNYHIFMTALMDMTPIKDEASALSPDYAKIIDTLKSKDTSDIAIRQIISTYGNMQQMGSISPDARNKARSIVLKRILHKDASLELDVMYVRTIAQQMHYASDTLSKKQLAAIKSQLNNKWMLADLIEINDRITQTLHNIPSATTNLSMNTTPADSFFTQLLDRYKGKVIFIDYWATWCAPCIEGIKRIAPVKEELAQNKDIVFLYITNRQSPEKTYQSMIPGIKGEHYRISDDQYNALSAMFQITGIPHYAIINKQGQVVNKDFHWSQPHQVKEQLTSLASIPYTTTNPATTPTPSTPLNSSSTPLTNPTSLNTSNATINSPTPSIPSPSTP